MGGIERNNGSLWSGVTNLFGSSSDFKIGDTKGFKDLSGQDKNITTAQGIATASASMGYGGTLSLKYPYSVKELEQRNLAQEKLNKNILTINLISKKSFTNLTLVHKNN
jgi:hypothetical protein